MKIKELSEDDRPREKVMVHGVETVSNAELLAILIGSGSPEVSAVELMRQILHDHGDKLRVVSTLSRQVLESYNGIGPAKAVTIQAALELGKRFMREKSIERPNMTTSEAAYDYLCAFMRDLTHEEVHALYINVRNQLLDHQVISSGGISEASVDCRLILKHAVLCGASGVLLAHNHPTGNLVPSVADDDMTYKVKRACDAIGCKLLDHLIIGGDRYYSYSDMEKL